MHSFFYHAAGETVDVVDGGLGDVVRAGGGSSFSCHAFEDHCVVAPHITTDLPNINDDEFMVNPIANFQELLMTGAVEASTPLLPRRPTKPPPRAVPSLSSTSRVLGISKRRKGQAKKVVCVPAPAPADQESNIKTNVVVPSDLWAWRKYGQKPIKGSPYPRGYYKCSSSKGCLARKQVERSPSDPTMLVITYTAEHNHPWPTQRNSLAGSSRSSHPKKHSTNMDNLAPASKNSTSHHTEEEEEEATVLHSSSPPLETAVVKEENWETFEQIFMMSNSCYQPLQTQLESENLDFVFAELGGLDPDPDPVSLIFSSRDAIGDDRLQLEGETKALDPLSLFDWDGN